ncbi:MAG: VOC family protein [Nitrospirota bacterium]|nr:VOC family protein [Nitrospirota bacterium]MDE3243300.1 VOC family protein [Nitrospirota bacterium]
MIEPEAIDRRFNQAWQGRLMIVHRLKCHWNVGDSFYVADPDGNTVRILSELTISKLQ